MAVFDMPVAQLATYRSGVQPPADLDAFWGRTLQDARAAGGSPRVEPVDSGLRLVRTFDVTFPGFGGHPIKAWYQRPAGAAGDGDLPVVVRYQGYGGGRGMPHQLSPWAPAGYACLEVDTRGQGGSHRPGATPDPVGAGPAHPGYLTRGILDPQEYYYRRVYTDAVRAVDCARGLPGVDPARVAVAGVSQGGGIALAVAGLVADLSAVLADVPFLSDFPRALDLAVASPYEELVGYLAANRHDVEQALATLAYVDAAVLARTARAPALFSVALMDTVCPPSTVYAAYNAYAGPKEIRTYPYNGHEGGAMVHEAEQLRWLAEVLPVEAP